MRDSKSYFIQAGVIAMFGSIMLLRLQSPLGLMVYRECGKRALFKLAEALRLLAQAAVQRAIDEDYRRCP